MKGSFVNKEECIKELKEKVYSSKNNFIDISYILEKLGMDKESKLILSKMKEVL